MADKPPRATPVPFGRLSRLGRLGSLTAGVVGNMAVQGLGQLGRGQRPVMRDLLLTPGNIARITDQLARMRGAAMKIGQLVSMDGGDVLPPELAQIMARLRSDAHVMPPKQLKSVLAAQWPAGWLQSFQRFDVTPIAAASIGQVHRARLRDGRDLAIKLQYPGVAQSIDSDVKNVGALIRMSGLVPSGFDLSPYLDEARRQLHEETDYLREGQQMQRFRDLLQGDDRFTVPDLVPDWTTPAILAMTYAPGRPIDTLAGADQAIRNRVTRDLIDLVLAELFQHGWMQTDPNFANYLYDADGDRVVLLDFGAARQIAPDVITLFRSLIRAGLSGDRTALEHAIRDLGFFGPDTPPPQVDRILTMAAMVFDTLTATAQVDFASTDLNRRLQAEGTALAADGYVPPLLPMDVLYVQRKVAGMFLLATRLGAQVPVRDMLAEV